MYRKFERETAFHLSRWRQGPLYEGTLAGGHVGLRKVGKYPVRRVKHLDLLHV
jgi:hypothetical protein